MRIKIAEKLVYGIFHVSMPITVMDILKGSLVAIIGIVGCYGLIILIFILDYIVFGV